MNSSIPNIMRSRILPLDVWYEIAEYLDVTQLTRLGAVSKNFRESVHFNRSIWYKAVRKLIVESFVAPCSFSVQNATTDTLRSIATRQPRFIFAIRKGRSKYNSSAYTDLRSELNLASKSFTRASDHNLKAHTGHPFHQLLRGGRWLLSASNDDVEISGRLVCWDLRQPDKSPVVHTLPDPLELSEDAEDPESAVLTQFSPADQQLVIMARLLTDEGFEIHIVALSWCVDLEQGVDVPRFTPIVKHRFLNQYLMGSQLEGNLAIVKDDVSYTFWNWRESTVVRFSLAFPEDEPIKHILSRDDAILGITDMGRIVVFELPEFMVMPNDTPIELTHPHMPHRAVSWTHGTLRQCTVIDDWLPIYYRTAPLLCLKATPIPSSYSKSVEARVFPSCPAIFFNYGRSLDEPTPELNPVEPQVESGPIPPASLLPRLVHHGRGNLDWGGVFTLTAGWLLEQSVRFQAPPGRSRVVPVLWFDFHRLLSSSRDSKQKRVAPFLGTLILETSQFMDGTTEEEFRQAISICYLSGRVVVFRPRVGTIEIFDFE